MQNFILNPFLQKIYFKIAQFAFSENRIHHIVAIENIAKSKAKETSCGFALACKNFSLPATVVDKDFQVITQGENVPCFSLNMTDYDLAVSLFNLHDKSREEQIVFLKHMKQSAKKAVFLEYENPERNMAYLGYVPILFGLYSTAFWGRFTNKKDNSFTHIKKYLAGGALEGILHDLPLIFPNHTVKILKRQNWGIGGIGFAYVEWD